jgi:hypothetical protein
MYKIRRVTYLSDATLGVLLDPEGVPICLTAELPWKDNEPYVSCIPEGTYQAIKVMSHKRGYEVFEIVSVPGRTLIQIHVANAPMRPINKEGETELLGCIAPGMKYGGRGGYNGVNQSMLAFERVMKLPKQIIIKIENT